MQNFNLYLRIAIQIKLFSPTKRIFQLQMRVLILYCAPLTAPVDHVNTTNVGALRRT